MEDRDTKFVPFAKVLIKELQYDGLLNCAESELSPEKKDAINQEIEHAAQLLIAQRTYDLMYAIIKSYGNMHGYDLEYSVSMIPDIRELPKVSQQEKPPSPLLRPLKRSQSRRH